jgi:hypothetical protein
VRSREENEAFQTDRLLSLVFQGLWNVVKQVEQSITTAFSLRATALAHNKRINRSIGEPDA